MIHAASEHRDGVPAGLQGAVMRGRVDATRHAADDGQAGLCQVKGQAIRRHDSVVGGPPRPDDSEHQGLQQFGASPGEEH